MSAEVQIAVEVSRRAWSLFEEAIDGLDDAEINWRPLPQANTIEIIVRHLRIEAQWHVDGLARGASMPADLAAIHQHAIDAVPQDFHANVAKLRELYEEFLGVLGTLSLREVEQRTVAAYGASAAQRGLPHLLGYHQAMHVAMHCAQIRTLRNLYRTTRGQPARFFPDNPTYPRDASIIGTVHP